MSLYPDNIRRYERLQNLYSQIGSRNTDISNAGKDLEDYQKRLESMTEKLIAVGKMKTGDQAMSASQVGLTDEQKSQMNKIMDSGKKLSPIADILFKVGFSCGVSAIVGESLAYTLRVIHIAREAAAGIEEARGLMVDGGVEAAIQWRQVLVEALHDPLANVDPHQRLVPVGRLQRFAHGISTFCKFLNVVGLVAVSAGIVVQLVEGPKQKENLIKAIQDAQVARLNAEFIRQKNASLLSSIALATLHVQALADERSDAAAYVAKSYVELLQAEEEKEVDWPALQKSLEDFDQASGLHMHVDDDLTCDQVVSRMRKAMETGSMY